MPQHWDECGRIPPFDSSTSHAYPRSPGSPIRSGGSPLLWALATAGVIVAIAATSVATGIYRSRRVGSRDAPATEPRPRRRRLLGSIQQEMNHRLAWQLSHDPRDADALIADRAATRRGIARFAGAIRAARARCRASVGDAQALASAIRALGGSGVRRTARPLP